MGYGIQVSLKKSKGDHLICFRRSRQNEVLNSQSLCYLNFYVEKVEIQMLNSKSKVVNFS